MSAFKDITGKQSIKQEANTAEKQQQFSQKLKLIRENASKCPYLGPKGEFEPGEHGRKILNEEK